MTSAIWKAPAATAFRRRGISLIEVIVSTLLVGLVLVTSMRTVGGVFRTWQATAEQHDGMALAADLMTEVMQAHYVEPDGSPAFGRESGESSSSRALWDDTDDYDDWTASPPQTKGGAALTAYSGWRRSVVVEKVTVGDPNGVRNDSSSDKQLRRITVTVTAPDGRQTVLVGLRSEYGMMERQPIVAKKFVTWVGSELQVGVGAAAIRSGTNVTNHAVDQ